MRLKIKKSRKYRLLVYYGLVFITACFIGAYFHNSILVYLGFFLILLSIFFELMRSNNVVQEIILSDEYNDSALNFVIDDNESNFWLIKKHIIISGWIYLYAIQQGSNKKFKIWLHKSNFVDENHIRDLARFILFVQNNKS